MTESMQTPLRQQAEMIWRAGVAAVDSERLVRNVVKRDGNRLHICGEVIDLTSISRIVVVGAGKAGAGMARGIEKALDVATLSGIQSVGWINVPADCVTPLKWIHLHPARPAGVNEPTADGVVGSEKILELVDSLTSKDICLVLISGGGSALLPAPIDGITLKEKRLLTRSLSAAGATIQELNTVRKQLSRIKGGGLLRAASAGRMISLIISDVAGDPLDVIASGPTVASTSSAKDAIRVLESRFSRNAPDTKIPSAIWKCLDRQAAVSSEQQAATIHCLNRIIGNNQTAIDAAATEARRLGYEVVMLGTNRQGIARDVGEELALVALTCRDEDLSIGRCFLAGGEPVVKLSETDQPRRGGRNQEVALAAGCRLLDEDISHIALLSGGTDGEDGPTDAAGACFDSSVQKTTHELGLDMRQFLAINDSYTFFSKTGGLLKTGPTHTNVMDLQVVLVAGSVK
jgi:hydroxypyruvate reductase